MDRPLFKMIFITGAGRSGTSLLQSMLAAHPLVDSPPETGFIRRLLITNDLSRVIRKGTRQNFERFLKNDRFFHRMNLPAEEIIRSYAATEGEPEGVRFYKLMMQRFLSKSQKQILCDKDPRLVEFYPYLKRFWPEAVVIHIIRDPRDVLLSKKRAAWSRKRPTLFHILIGSLQLEIGRKTGPLFFGPSYVEISYERLIDSPKRELERLCRKIAIPFNRDMLSFERASRHLVFDDEMPWKKETLKPISPNNCNKWKQGLNAFEIAMCESVNTEAFENLHYQISHSDLHLKAQQRVTLRLLAPIFRTLKNAGIQYRLWKQS